MTPAQIRKATPFPKPKGAIANAMRELNDPRWWLGRDLLRHIVEHADLVGTDGRVLLQGMHGDPRPVAGKWLLVPLPLDMLDKLARFEADLAELEATGDDEPDDDGEPSLGSPENVSQGQWAQCTTGFHVDAEADNADAEPNLGAPERHHSQGLWADGGADDREEDVVDGREDDDTEGQLPFGDHLEHGRGLGVARPMIPVRETALDSPALGKFYRLT